MNDDPGRHKSSSFLSDDEVAPYILVAHLEAWFGVLVRLVFDRQIRNSLDVDSQGRRNTELDSGRSLGENPLSDIH